MSMASTQSKYCYCRGGKTRESLSTNIHQKSSRYTRSLCKRASKSVSWLVFFPIDLNGLKVVRKATCGCDTAPASRARRATEPSGAENRKNPLACSGFENMKTKWEPLRNTVVYTLQEGFFSLLRDHQLLVISMLSMCWPELQVMLHCLDKCM